MNRFVLSRRGLVTAALAAPAILGSRARAAGTIQMISHRYPALEYYAEKMRTAIPGVTVNTQLMPIDKALELATIALSSKSDTPDIVYASDTSFQTFVKNGWFRPLDASGASCGRAMIRAMGDRARRCSTRRFAT